MFTGIIQETAKILEIKKQKYFYTHTICLSEKLLSGLKVGSSISYNGCCLTVTKILKNLVDFEIIRETLEKTNLKFLKINEVVNIERSLKISEEINGHIVYGHIMGKAKIIKIISRGIGKKIWFLLEKEKLNKYIIEQGSISIDGISLTISDKKNDSFAINFIPETIRSTNIKYRSILDIVNVEFDVFAKFVVDSVKRTLKNM
ncbi:riboflavin synthase subunit alpha [bacterium endosymbiont of Pedicinus badii]|uniref:riboflavin synthase subunit alpha n=1 Tax=bacterium endosymbiont of Pedicinus badii TaxID=1719126 RepID=UPI0009BA53AF|nr:riboflavin synthase subunit alpha [bacterium endosymbiont of Pedicinus badii]OQM34397.1 hypothetical protein AOQ89_00715 [bacterium endosymbiont of Pedicinus badii]